MVDYQGIAVVQANLGDLDNVKIHTKQSVSANYFVYTDNDLPPRRLAMTPRLQAKIPKCFAWQLKPNYQYYLWLDGNIRLAKPDTLKYLLEQLGDNDIVVIRHPSRPNIRQEVRYTRKGINQQSRYVVSRYVNELLPEIYELIEKDKDYTDDLLVLGGIFLYRNTPEVQAMLKEWWYYMTRYIIQDQISFPYVLKKSGVKIKVLEHKYTEWDMIENIRHKRNNQ